MSAQQSQGIQALLDAEKEAARIVEKAREYRSQKLKDARGEAAKEIESLKSKREEEFKEFEQQHSGNTDSQQKVLEEETKQKVSPPTVLSLIYRPFDLLNFGFCFRLSSSNLNLIK
ncbi:hypothetical protein H4Q26_013501 [Puccinia striiformis f. sp. tritici PST-130]|nr:hypothetical protein H4Q26_013501 [Puccinia striiformis f. sp. tritici PST-130]